jgi:hypothetical protein
LTDGIFYFCTMLRISSILILIFLSVISDAQPDFGRGQPQSEPQQPEDTTKLSINVWKLSDYYSKTVPVDLDTVITKMQLYNPLFRETKSATFTGNLGDPAVSNIYYQRFNFETSPYFLNPYRWYQRSPEEITYVNTTKPFTEIGYSFVPGIRDKDEQTAGVIHTQNVNPKLNVGFKYDYINARGQYKRQRNTIGQATFFGSYRENRYEFHGNVNIGSIENQYNGGIPDSLFKNPVDDTKNYPVNLDNASSATKSRSILISQKLYFGAGKPSEDDTIGFKREDALAFLSHSLEGNLHKRTFIDDIGKMGSTGLGTPDRSFYDSVYINDEITTDSTYYHSFKSTLLLELFEKKNYFLPVGLNVGIQNELQRYYTSTMDTAGDFLPGRSNNFFNSAFIANAYHQTGKMLNWKAKGGFYFTGRKANDYFLNGNINTIINIKNTAFELNAAADISKTTPDYFIENLTSNHFIWRNSFSDVSRLKLSGSLFNREYKFSVGIHSTNTDNFIYFDENANAAQTSVPVSVLALYLKKRFDVWKLVWDNNIHYQMTDRNAIVSIPDVAVYSSLYLDHVIKFKFTNGAIYFQIGADLFYNSEYYAYKFMPAFEQYYIQDVRKIGNYPFIDPFVNVRIKRTRVYLKYKNIGALFLDKNYFSAVQHPRNLGVLKFGLYWTFYD